MKQKIEIVFDYSPAERWAHKGVYCSIPEQFDFIDVLNYDTGKSIDYWEKFEDVIYSEYLDNVEGSLR